MIPGVLDLKNSKSEQLAQVFITPNGVRDIADLNAEDNVCGTGSDDLDHSLPVYDTIATGAADGGTGRLPPFSIALRKTDVFGM